MPKFYKQNKKRRNPRYFLNETSGYDLLWMVDDDGTVDPEEAEDLTNLINTMSVEELSEAIDDLEMDQQDSISQYGESEKHKTLIQMLNDTMAARTNGNNGGGQSQPEYSSEEEDQIRSSVLGSMAKNPPSTPWSKGR